MGLTAALRGHRVYVDANILIYAVEGFEGLDAAIEELRRLLSQTAITAFTSEFSLCEVLVRPLARGDREEVALYRSLLEASGAFTLLPATRETFVEAARLRSSSALRAPDAVHVATALQAGCDVFLSNDKRLRLPAGLALVSLPSTRP